MVALNPGEMIDECRLTKGGPDVGGAVASPADDWLKLVVAEVIARGSGKDTVTAVVTVILVVRLAMGNGVDDAELAREDGDGIGQHWPRPLSHWNPGLHGTDHVSHYS